MKYITVQIGNSDNKLSQVEWSEFVQHAGKIISENCHKQHFFGGSVNWAVWQNVSWSFECPDENIPNLKAALAVVGRKYQQDAVAYTEGEIEFL